MKFFRENDAALQQISSFFEQNDGHATNNVGSGKNRIAKSTVFIVFFEASTLVVAIHRALGVLTRF